MRKHSVAHPRIVFLIAGRMISGASRFAEQFAGKLSKHRLADTLRCQRSYTLKHHSCWVDRSADGAPSLNRAKPGYEFLVALVALVVCVWLALMSAPAYATEPGDLSCENPDIIKKYACLIMQEAEGAGTKGVAPVEFYAALQALNIVQNTVSSGRYSYLKRALGPEFKSIPEADLCLDAGYGICGNHIIVFNALMKELGIPARRVQFFYETDGRPNSHIASEVRVGDKWVFFDVTWGSVYFERPDDRSSYLSFADINRIGYENVFPLRNELSTWFFSRGDTSYETLAHMYVRNRDIVIDGVGAVAANLEWTGSNAKSNGRQTYGFIGDNTKNGPTAGASIYWQQPAGAYRLDMVSRNGGCITPSQVCVNDQCGPLEATGTSFDFESAGGRAVLKIKSDDDICYAVPSEIEITRLR